MEKIVWLEFLIHMFFDPNIQYRDKLPQDAPIAQCKEWLVQTQEMWAGQYMCGERHAENNLLAPFLVFQANRCHEILTRREAENLIREQPAYPLMDIAFDDEPKRNSAAAAAYCAGTENTAAYGKAFDQEWEKIQAAFRQPETPKPEKK